MPMSQGFISASMPIEAAEQILRSAKNEGVSPGEILRRGHILYMFYCQLKKDGYDLSGTKLDGEGGCDIFNLPSEPFLRQA